VRLCRISIVPVRLLWLGIILQLSGGIGLIVFCPLPTTNEAPAIVSFSAVCVGWLLIVVGRILEEVGK